MHSLDAEIFAAGTWNKTWKFTSKDLRDIVANFEALADNHKVPLKFGHNEQQPFTDGQPALGWVTKVWVNDDDKLMARFEHVPTVVKKAFDAKLYRHVSVELDVDVEHRGKKYKYVLSAVALLGADIPAVNTLKDLTSYLDGGERLAASRREVFSAIQGDLTNQQEDDMSEEIMKKLDALTAKFSQLSDEQAKTTAENAALKAKIGQLESEKAEAAKLEATGKVKMHRESLVGKLEAAVKDHRLTPAQREGAIKFMRLNDDEAAQKVTAEQVDEYIAINGGKAKMSSEQGRGQGTGGKDDSADGKKWDDAGAEIVARANKLRGEDAKLSFSAARDRVMEADPELANAWLRDEHAA